jgi:hypothetical protein
MADDPDDAGNVVSLEEFRDKRANGNSALDDDEIIRRANKKISEWKAAGTPSLTEVQSLFHESICAGASPMARDRIVAVILAVFGDELSGKRALIATWNRLVKDFAAECAQTARESTTQRELTPAEKAALREALWPAVCELAEAPDLIDRMVKQVEALGVVNERELVELTYIAATSRVLEHPVSTVTKGASSGGKSFTTEHTLELVGPDFVNKLTSSSALALVYDTRPLSHTVMLLFEANQLQADKQADKDSTFAQLTRSLLSEGRIIHTTSVEDANSPTGRRVERIVREGPVALITTTTGELYSENETRMLTWRVHEDADQTRAVMAGLADRAAGNIVASPDLAVWHDLQRWIALGPNDAVIPFARQITDEIEPAMVRFRRDTGSLLSFIKASAILHQAQRQVDPQGRVVATVADYALAYPIFSRVLAESAGKEVSDSVRAVVTLIAERTNAPATKPTGMTFQRVEVPGQAAAATTLNDQVGADAAAAKPTGTRFKRSVEVPGHGVEITISSEQLGTAIGIDKSAAYRAIRAALDGGYLVNNEFRQSKPFKLVLKHGVDKAGASLLPHPTTITSEGGAA